MASLPPLNNLAPSSFRQLAAAPEQQDPIAPPNFANKPNGVYVALRSGVTGPCLGCCHNWEEKQQHACECKGDWIEVACAKRLHNKCHLAR